MELRSPNRPKVQRNSICVIVSVAAAVSLMPVLVHSSAWDEQPGHGQLILTTTYLETSRSFDVLQGGALFLVFVLLTMWTFHLGRASLPAFWSYLLSALLMAELLLTLSRGHELPGTTLLATAWSSLLLYLLLHTVGAAIVTQELRAATSAAVVFGVAVHGRAVVMVAGVLRCAVLWFKCSPWYGGAVKSGLLIFTPAAVGVLTISVMKTMAPNLYRSASAVLAALSPDRIMGTEAMSSGLQNTLPASLFAAGAVVSRIVERRAGYGDLAYLALLLYLMAGLSLGRCRG